MVLEAQAAVTPAGKPNGVPIPVAPVVVCVIFVKGVLIHTVGVDEAAVTVFEGLTVTADVVAEQFVVELVKVKVAVPAATPFTTPAFVTVATPGLLLIHVPPEVGDKVVEEFALLQKVLKKPRISPPPNVEV